MIKGGEARMSEEAIKRILTKYIPPLTWGQVNEIARDIVDYVQSQAQVQKKGKA